MQMMETLLSSGVALAALTGVTILAYQQPDAYSKLCIPLVVVLGLVIVGLGVWNAAALTAKARLIKHLRSDAWEEAREDFEKVTAPGLWTVGLLLVQVYLLLLLGLPQLLHK
jgi:hypothetical protein